MRATVSPPCYADSSVLRSDTWRPRMGSDDLHRLRKWLRIFDGTWTHVRVSGIAYRVGETWHNRCCSFVLADSPQCPLGGMPLLETPHIFVFQRAVPITSLVQ